MSILREIKSHPITAVKTLVLYLSFVVLGLSSSIPGPTLLDLQLVVQTSLEKVTLILPSRSGGYAIGSIVIGILIDRVNTQRVLIGCLIVSMFAFGAAPWNHTLLGLCATLFVNGVAMGVLDTAGNVWCLHLWGKESTPFLQVLHLSFGVGAIIGPLIVKPFLLMTDQGQDSDIEFAIQTNGSEPTLMPFPAESETKIQYAYLIVSVINVVITVLFTIVYMKRPDNEPHPSKAVSVSGEEESYNPKARLMVICLSTVFLHFYFALEIVFGTFLTAYVVKSDLNLDKATGAVLSSVFWTTFTFFRIPSIFIIKLIGFERNITFNLAVIVLANCVLLPFGYSNLWAIWLGLVLMGIGISSIFATLLGYLEQYFPVTGTIASTFLVSSCVGEFIWPLVVGKFIDSNPRVFLVVIAGCSFCCCSLYAFVVYLCKNHVVKKKEISIDNNNKKF